MFYFLSERNEWTYIPKLAIFLFSSELNFSEDLPLLIISIF